MYGSRNSRSKRQQPHKYKIIILSILSFFSLDVLIPRRKWKSVSCLKPTKSPLSLSILIWMEKNLRMKQQTDWCNTQREKMDFPVPRCCKMMKKMKFCAEFKPNKEPHFYSYSFHIFRCSEISTERSPFHSNYGNDENLRRKPKMY